MSRLRVPPSSYIKARTAVPKVRSQEGDRVVLGSRAALGLALENNGGHWSYGLNAIRRRAILPGVRT